MENAAGDEFQGMNRDIDISARIRDEILDGQLPFGTRITIAEMAQRYGVSQMPIRTALSQLQGEGLLTVSDTGRTAIRSIDRSLISNIFNLRASIEVLLIRSATPRISSTDLDLLDATEHELEQLVANQDYPAVQVANRRFHSIIASAADNPDAVELLNRHFFLLAALWRRLSYGPERFSGVVNDHRFIIRAMRLRDAEAAGALAHAHVIKAKLAMLECFDREFPADDKRILKRRRPQKKSDQ